MRSDKWLVVGAHGQLGKYFTETLTAFGANSLSLGRAELDITNPDAVDRVLRDFRPTQIINCAAWVDVEAAEENVDDTFALNSDALANFVDFTKNTDALLVNFSTDYVFDGGNRSPYLPTDQVNPINVYGRSKVAGERLLQEKLPDNSLTVRTSWLIADSPKNFVSRVASKALAGETFGAAVDQTGTPTSCAELATVLVETLAKQRLTGTHHITNTGETTRAGWAEEIYRILGVNPELVRPATSETLPMKARRPLYAVLDSSENESIGIPTLSPWQSALAESTVIAKFKAHR